MPLLGKEPSRNDIVEAIKLGKITIHDIASLSDEVRLALETIVLSPVVDRSVSEFANAKDRFIDGLEIMPLESTSVILERALHAYTSHVIKSLAELLRGQARGELVDNTPDGGRVKQWTALFGQHFEDPGKLAEPVKSAYDTLGVEAIHAIQGHVGSNLTLSQWAQELHGARTLLTSIASLRKMDSDTAVRPLRLTGELQEHITRRNTGSYHVDMSHLVPHISRAGRGCPANSVDRDGAPHISNSLLLAVHAGFTSIVTRMAERYPQR